MLELYRPLGNKRFAGFAQVRPSTTPCESRTVIDPNDTAQPPLSPFAQAGAALLAAGYHPLPVAPAEKAPGQYAAGKWSPLLGWTVYRDLAPGPTEMRLWSEIYPDA